MRPPELPEAFEGDNPFGSAEDQAQTLNLLGPAGTTELHSSSNIQILKPRTGTP